MKKLLSVLLAVLMAVTSFTALGITSFAEETQNGWVKEAISYEDDGEFYSMDIWYYYVNGEKTIGWKKIGGKWYVFDEDGWMLDNRFYSEGNNLYRLNEKGAMVTGWYKDSFYNEEDGKTYGFWYYFEASGKAAKGWKKISGKWYYFDKDFAIMYADGTEEINGKHYYFDKNGAMVTGWKKLDGYWFYFTSNGLAKGWIKVSGKWYYFKPLADNDVESMAIGWKKISGKWYYFNKDGSMVTGSKKIGKKTYKFDKNGVCQNP